MGRASECTRDPPRDRGADLGEAAGHVGEEEPRDLGAQLIDEMPRVKGQATRGVSFAFAHALIPATLHDSLSGLRRQRLHRRAAQAIERIANDRVPAGELAAQLGRHYAQAGESEKAIEYLLKAGDQARSVYAYEEAIAHYQQALAFLKDQGPLGLARPRARR